MQKWEVKKSEQPGLINLFMRLREVVHMVESLSLNRCQTVHHLLYLLIRVYGKTHSSSYVMGIGRSCPMWC